MPDVILSTVKAEDPEYCQVWQLREDVLRAPLGLSLVNEDLSGEAAEIILAAFVDGAMVGCVMLRHISATEIKLRQMAVLADWQGKGIGRMLLSAAEQKAAEMGSDLITLHARATAVPFYEKAGYVADGAVFTEVGIPHLFMKKTINA